VSAPASFALKVEIPPTAVGGLLTYDLQHGGLQAVNPTNGSWWKFHLLLKARLELNNPPTAIGGICRSHWSGM
jgi:hypothetical protein